MATIVPATATVTAPMAEPTVMAAPAMVVAVDVAVIKIMVEIVVTMVVIEIVMEIVVATLKTGNALDRHQEPAPPIEMMVVSVTLDVAIGKCAETFREVDVLVVQPACFRMVMAVVMAGSVTSEVGEEMSGGPATGIAPNVGSLCSPPRANA